MSRIPSAPPAALPLRRTDAASRPSPAPGRLDISAIENRLFSSAPSRKTAPAAPGRGIAQTLKEVRTSTGGTAPRVAQRNNPVAFTPPSRTVSFADRPEVGRTPNSWQAASSRVAVDFDALTQALPVLDDGDEVSTRYVRKLLLQSLAANTDHGLVSARSEKLLVRALDEIGRNSGHSCQEGSLPFDVLHSFISRAQHVRPDLFR